MASPLRQSIGGSAWPIANGKSLELKDTQQMFNFLWPARAGSNGPGRLQGQLSKSGAQARNTMLKPNCTPETTCNSTSASTRSANISSPSANRQSIRPLGGPSAVADSPERFARIAGHLRMSGKPIVPAEPASWAERQGASRVDPVFLCDDTPPEAKP